MQGSRPKILIVDDEELVTKSLSRILEKASYQVDCASSPDEALKLCNANLYSAIILDCLLPQKSGLALAQEIKRTQEDNVQYIFMSGVYSDPSFINSCLSDVGASRFYKKPFNAKDLLDHLEITVRGQFEYKTLLETIYSLPNPSPAEIINLVNSSMRVTGFEIPFLIAQVSRLKISRVLNLYIDGEIVYQLRFLNGSIIQFFNFLKQETLLTNPIDGLNQIVNANKLELQFCKADGVSSNVQISPVEILTWAENLSFTHLPVYWIVSRLLPLVTKKLYSTMDYNKQFSAQNYWPMAHPERFELDSLVGTTILRNFESSAYSNDDLFICIYNFLLNGSAWVDSIKKSFSEEALCDFFSWHYNHLAERNSFEIFELLKDELVDESPVYLSYKNMLDELRDFSFSDQVIKWIELEQSLLDSTKNTLTSNVLREKYIEELEANEASFMAEVDKISPEVKISFENNHAKRVLTLMRKVARFPKLNSELRLFYFWANLVSSETDRSSNNLKILKSQLHKIPTTGDTKYIQRFCEALISKFENNLPVARRQFVEAQGYNLKSRAAERELKAMAAKNHEPPVWYQKAQNFLSFNKSTIDQ